MLQRIPNGSFIRSVMNVTVNDDGWDVEPGTTVTDLLIRLKLNPKFVAVERNRELVPRRMHRNCRLQPGDQLEVVTLVGGG